nr:hypothetical protein CFP56_23852 [Quercus suber]
MVVKKRPRLKRGLQEDDAYSAGLTVVFDVSRVIRWWMCECFAINFPIFAILETCFLSWFVNPIVLIKLRYSGMAVPCHHSQRRWQTDLALEDCLQQYAYSCMGLSNIWLIQNIPSSELALDRTRVRCREFMDTLTRPSSIREKSDVLHPRGSDRAVWRANMRLHLRFAELRLQWSRNGDIETKLHDKTQADPVVASFRSAQDTLRDIETKLHDKTQADPVVASFRSAQDTLREYLSHAFKAIASPLPIAANAQQSRR